MAENGGMGMMTQNHPRAWWHRWSKRRIALFVRLYLAGTPMDELSRQFERGPKALQHFAHYHPYAQRLRRDKMRRIRANQVWTDANLRVAIKMYFVDRLSFKQISNYFGRDGEWAVRTELYRPRGQRLRKQMGIATHAPPRHELAGKKFGLLTVIRRVPVEELCRLKKMTRHTMFHTHWVCRCKCGTIRTVDVYNLIKGRARSCGNKSKHYINEKASRFKHGRYSKRFRYTQNSYACMLARCTNESDIAYESYGGRGVKVCERWRNSFFNFVEDMGRRPKDRSLDRLNPHLNYSCGHCEECIGKGWTANCKWSTDKQQSTNKRVHHPPPTAPTPELDDVGNEVIPF
jgi:hypothetical protein